MTDIQTKLKGPWTLLEQGEPNQYVIVMNQKEWIMALKTNGELHRDEDQQLIDLILAAPQMKMKLAHIRNWLSCYRNIGKGDFDFKAVIPEMLESIDSVFKPSTGQADQSANVQ